MYFLEYELQHKGYMCYNQHTKKLIISRHVTFDEDSIPKISEISKNDPKNRLMSIPPALLTPSLVALPKFSDSHSVPTQISNVPANLVGGVSSIF